MVGEEVDHPLASTVVRQATWCSFVPSPCALCGYCHNVQTMSQRFLEVGGKVGREKGAL
jgi:hypothetical protein